MAAVKQDEHHKIANLKKAKEYHPRLELGLDCACELRDVRGWQIGTDTQCRYARRH